MDEKIMEYEDFKRIFTSALRKNKVEEIRKFLEDTVKNVYEYIGIDNYSSIEDTYIARERQSTEIKYGNALENILTSYISLMGYKNLDKKIGKAKDGKELNADQVFVDEKTKTVYLIEQKKKDNHDSTKKRGQIENFKKKIDVLSIIYPKYKIVGVMWFLNNQIKNKKFYLEEMAKITNSRISLNLYYGDKLFSDLFKRMDVWTEMLTYLKKIKKERKDKVIKVPNFDTSTTVLKALEELKKNKPKIYKKFMSSNVEYIQLRAELFTTGENLEKVKKI